MRNWQKQLRKLERTVCTCTVCACVLEYLPLLLGLQGLQELDLFLRLCIHSDDLISRRKAFQCLNSIVCFRFLVDAVICDSEFSNKRSSQLNNILTNYLGPRPMNHTPVSLIKLKL